jgi:hypothetical protein
MSFADHLETHLGTIDGGFKAPDGSGFHIVYFKDKPFTGIVSYATLGLSRHLLALPESGHTILQELVFFATHDVDVTMAVSFINHLAEQMVATHQGLYRSEYIVNDDPIFEGSAMNAIYCSVPMIVSDDFCLYVEGDTKVILVWLIPVYGEEADYIKTNGGDKFAELLEEKNPDLWDLNRPSVL